MNANELADKRHDCQTFTELLVWGMDAEEMLRQQQAEIEALKEKLTYAKDTIESIVWTDRKPFDDSGWASVSFSALAKGADFLRKLQYK